MRSFSICLLLLVIVFNTVAQNNTIISSNSHALSFDGVDDYVQMMDHPAYKNLQELTVMLWVKSADTKRMGTLVDCIDSCNTRGTWAFRNYKDHLRWFVGNEATYHGKAKLPVIPQQWQHYAFSFSDKEDLLRIYIDGQLVATQSVNASMTSAATLLRIGNDLPGGGSLPFKGILDEVKIWNRVFSSEEEIYLQMYAVPTKQTSHLLGYWSFNEGQGYQSNDYSNQQNHGTIHGANWTTDTPFNQTNISNYSHLSIHPNPVQRSAKLQYNGTLPQWIEIVDTHGRVLEKITTPAQISDYRFENYPTGIYFLRYPYQIGLQSYKIIVE